MSSEVTTSPAGIGSDTSSAVEQFNTLSALPNDSEVTITSMTLEEFSSTESVYNTTGVEQPFVYSESQVTVFQAFIIIEIVMTALELIISIWAAIKMARWRKNYRNQMIMQLSLSRFIKRIIFLLMFFEEHNMISPLQPAYFRIALKSIQIYIDFVIVILVLFFIKHMYDSLIIVLVRISHNSLNKVLACAWLIPAPVSAVWTAIIVYEVMDQWHVDMLICAVFRWPLIFLGTALYITILIRVLSDKIRRFARSLTVVTFLMCLDVNIYLFSKDVIDLWCIDSFTTNMVSYLSSFFLNFLILCFYLILITLCCRQSTQSTRPLPDYNLTQKYNVKEIML